MLKHFSSQVLAENGFNCDCCVRTSRVKADVYARDEMHALELIRTHDPLAAVVIESLEDKGIIEGVKNPGVIVVNSVCVYEGYHGNSPLRRE